MDRDPATDAAESQTQRVRVGLIGLAFVFLLVMLATALFSLGRDGGDLVNQTSDPAAIANDSSPREPLAELGVAPGNPVAPTPATKPPATH